MKGGKELSVTSEAKAQP